MATQSQSARDQRATETRERIMREAAVLMERFTMAKLTIEDVARAAGITRQTVYKHFKGKDDLVSALFVRFMVDEHHPVIREMAARELSEDALLDMVLAEIDMGADYALFDPMLDPVVAPRVGDLIFASTEIGECREELWLPILADYLRAGLLRPGLDHHAIVRWVTYQQYWLMTHPTVLTTDAEERRRYVREFIIRLLLR